MVEAARLNADADSHVHERCLVLRDVTIAYGQRVIVAHINADIPRGQVVSLVGPNGAGKSTLLKAISGLVPLAGGEIRLFDEPITRQRRRMAYVPQREDVDWDFPISALEVVTMGRVPRRGWIAPTTAEDRNIAMHALEHLGIADLATRQINELSGGQQRRAFIARALAQEPDLILLDEPMAGVDSQTHDRILELFDDWRSQGKVVIQATHTDVHGGSMIVLRRRTEPIAIGHMEHHAFEAGEHHGHDR